MIITRKIQVYVSESDLEQKRAYIKTLYDWRNIVRKASNMVVSHLFMLENTTPYLSEESRNSLVYLGAKGGEIKKLSATYVVLSKAFKDQINTSILSSVDKNVRGMWSDKNIATARFAGKRSIPSFTNNIPIPFKCEFISNIHFSDYQNNEGENKNGCFFTLFGIPFQCRFGIDRSNNRLMVERCTTGEYKIKGSSLQIDDTKKKMFLLLTMDIPKTENKPIEGKTLYAFLGVFNPILATVDVKAKTDFDSGMKVFEIGTENEFNYQRRQIQEAVKRCQTESKYTKGGKGRKRKLQAIERFNEKEKNYVDTKLHTYSRMLVDLAVKHRCDTIHLLKQEVREIKAKDENMKGNPFVLRNWSYYGLKSKIEYKAKMNGIVIKQDKQDKESEDLESFD